MEGGRTDRHAAEEAGQGREHADRLAAEREDRAGGSTAARSRERRRRTGRRRTAARRRRACGASVVGVGILARIARSQHTRGGRSRCREASHLLVRVALRGPGSRGFYHRPRADRCHWWRTRRPLLQPPDEEGAAGIRGRGRRTQPCRRHLRLGRGVLQRDARPLPPGRPGELPAHHRGLRLLGQHRHPLQGSGDPLGRPRLLRDRPPPPAADPSGARPQSSA